ncbi:hypothetical protein EAE96_008622 [Botrytis aclada]|nr:hypothetical protein EAE96_008622 [Botrytis aclada]
MHFSTLVTLTLSVFSARAIGDDCMQGWKYCGTDLLAIGNYQNNIVQALNSAGLPYDTSHVYHTLFECAENGLLKTDKTGPSAPQYCGEYRCQLGGMGSGKNDTCPDHGA